MGDIAADLEGNTPEEGNFAEDTAGEGSRASAGEDTLVEEASLDSSCLAAL